MLRTFLVIVILSSLIISNGNLYEPKWLNHQIGKMQTCSIIKCAPQTCRIRCVPTLTTTTITPTTPTTTTMSTITSTTTTVIPTAVTWTTAISTTNTKADYTENQEVILVFFFQNEVPFLLLLQLLFPQQEEPKYTCLWMSSSHSYGEPKLVCIPKLNLLDVIRM